MMRVVPSLLRACGIIFAAILLGPAAYGFESLATSGLRQCTHASLHKGKCVRELEIGEWVAITDARTTTEDRCAKASRGGGDEFVVCEYGDLGWSEFGASPSTSGGIALAATAEWVLDILDPPPGSGLVPPVGDGIDGQPGAPRTDDAGAITAAIQYACDIGYDIAYLGPGTYRIGVDHPASFYSGIRIDATLCPNGIKFYGAGVGQTVLLANGAAGQYIVFTTDEYHDDTRVFRAGWNSFGHAGDTVVTGITTGVTPPVVTGSDESHLYDGDTVFIRNCSGVTQANEQTFKVNNCTDVAPFSCELQDEYGVDIDASSWDAWTSDTKCIVHKMNPDFTAEIAFMTLRDDDRDAHMNIVCDPLCGVSGEESHGIGILQGGGVAEVHNVMISGVGDEGIDISAPESPTYVHDVSIVNAIHGGLPIYQGVGIRIEDVWVHKNESSPWTKIDVGSTQYIPYTAGNAFSISPGDKNWRVVDFHANRIVATGEVGYGFGIYTTFLWQDGQAVSGVKVTNSLFSLNPLEVHCDDSVEFCGSWDIKSKLPGAPIENIEVSGNTMTGTSVMVLANGNGGVLLKNNTITPIPTLSPRWGILASAKETTIEGNHIYGFERGCILYQPYETVEDVSTTITTTVKGNTFECDSNVSGRDTMIGPSAAPYIGPPAPTDAGHFRILDNDITAHAGDFIRRGVVIIEDWKNVEICRNTITLDPSLNDSSSFGIWSYSADQLICDNTISLKGSGIRANANHATIVGNTIDGLDDEAVNGILVIDSSDSLILNNEVVGYRDAGSVGVKVEAGSAAQSDIRIVGNQIGPSGAGIELDGNALGLDEVSIMGNQVEMDGFAQANAIHLVDATHVRITVNDLMGLHGSSANALLTVGTTDFIMVQDNVAEGGGTFKFGTTGGDASCDPAGGVGANSTCSGNALY